MSYSFLNKKIFLTGATGSIGNAIAKLFNICGGILICTGTNQNKLDEKSESNDSESVTA